MKIKIDIGNSIELDENSNIEIIITWDLIPVKNECRYAYFFNINYCPLRIADYLYLKEIEPLETSAKQIMFKVSFLHTKFEIPILFIYEISEFPTIKQLEIIIFLSINKIIKHYCNYRMSFNCKTTPNTKIII